jgi:hypothetical protein
MVWTCILGVIVVVDLFSFIGIKIEMRHVEDYEQEKLPNWYKVLKK